MSELTRRADNKDMSVRQFVLMHAPPPARLLEVGCGDGELALKLVESGYDVIAIDPDAPAGEVFRSVSLENFEDRAPFDVVVASRSMHHIADLRKALKKIHSLLIPSGVLILNEFAWDQMDERTAQWYLSQVEEPGPKGESLHPGKFPEAWVAEHDRLHDSRTIRRGLDELFVQRSFEWVTYISAHYLERPELVHLEDELIRADAINPIGFRYVGVGK